MNILEVFKNEFLHKLGLDHIAVDANGVPIARASDRASVEKAAPNAAAYFSGADFTVPELPAAAETTKTVEYFPAPPPELVAPEAPVVAGNPVSDAPEAPVVVPSAPFISAFTIDSVSSSTGFVDPTTVVPNDERSQTANQAPDAPAETEVEIPASEKAAPDAPVDPATLN